MSLYAMGDFHLNFGCDRSMDQYGDIWVGHEKRIEKYIRKYVKDEDTLVITGDHTKGYKMREALPDLEFIATLPGRKILLRGNHDTFWKSGKTENLNKEFDGKLFFLQDNFYTYGDYALVGSKGYCYEGKDTIEHFLKIRDREMERLQTSIDKAREAGYEKFIIFLHYPPTTIGEEESPFTLLAEKIHARMVIYSHCHGDARFYDSFHGMVNGVEYKLVSSDFLKFKPLKLC